MPRHEAQTRFDLIDPALVDVRGWNRADIRIEETLPPVDIVYGKGRRRAKGRTDYVLQRPALHTGQSVAIPPPSWPTLPLEWEVADAGRDALVKMVGERAEYVAGTFGPALAAQLHSNA